MRLLGYDHVGIRVTDRERSLAFYNALGFHLDAEHSSDTALEIVNADGLRLNLILNGEPTPDRDNVLLDGPRKWPGYTHAAFIVPQLGAVLAWAAARGVRITEGPVDWGRRITCFLRDPDSNVLEFNELRPAYPPYTLVIGSKNYSSWSMRAWLVMHHLGLPFEEVTVDLYSDGSREAVRKLGGETGLVPVLKRGDFPIWDTLAIFETLEEAHGGVWPKAPDARARARSLAGEIHSGFNDLRAAMPVNTRARGRAAVRNAAVEADIARAIDIWASLAGGEGRWLFGEFGGADIMFAPIATRFQTYGVELPLAAAVYRDALLSHPLVAEWLVLGAAETNRIESLEIGCQQ